MARKGVHSSSKEELSFVRTKTLFDEVLLPSHPIVALLAGTISAGPERDFGRFTDAVLRTSLAYTVFFFVQASFLMCLPRLREQSDAVQNKFSAGKILIGGLLLVTAYVIDDPQTLRVYVWVTMAFSAIFLAVQSVAIVLAANKAYERTGEGKPALEIVGGAGSVVLTVINVVETQTKCEFFYIPYIAVGLAGLYHLLAFVSPRGTFFVSFLIYVQSSYVGWAGVTFACTGRVNALYAAIGVFLLIVTVVWTARYLGKTAKVYGIDQDMEGAFRSFIYMLTVSYFAAVITHWTVATVWIKVAMVALIGGAYVITLARDFRRSSSASFSTL